ncbi:hypothetical protein [Candidatus Phytoplasma oryzae]|nr:hypothetical protein PIE28_01780 [Candidatus Phytoplasma oryzae]
MSKETFVCRLPEETEIYDFDSYLPEVFKEAEKFFKNMDNKKVYIFRKEIHLIIY